MKVVLQKDIKGLGKKDQAVEVADGYARNYLIPRGLALEASSGALKQAEDARQAKKRKEEREEAQAREVARRLKETGITIRVRAGEQGRLYGSVTSKDVADALKSVVKLDVDRRKIELEDPIRTVGEHHVDIKLYPGITASVKVVVVPE